MMNKNIERRKIFKGNRKHYEWKVWKAKEK